MKIAVLSVVTLSLMASTPAAAHDPASTRAAQSQGSSRA